MNLDSYKTNRLLLFLPDERLTDGVTDYYRRNMAFLRSLEPARDSSFYLPETQRKLLLADMANMSNKSGLRLWYASKREPDKIIGMVSLNNIVWGDFLSCFLSYKSDKDEVRKGYVTEAVSEIIEIAFNEMGLHRIEANIMPRNLPSMGVVEGLGFKNEGLSPKYLKINGVWEDHIHMVLLRENGQ